MCNPIHALPFVPLYVGVANETVHEVLIARIWFLKKVSFGVRFMGLLLIEFGASEMK